MIRHLKKQEGERARWRNSQYYHYQIWLTFKGGKKKKYTGPNYRCMVKSGVGLVSGAIGGSPFGVGGIVGGGMAGLVGGAISCLNNK